MIVTVPKKDLVALLSRCISTIDKKCTIPVSQMFLLRAKSGSLTALATDGAVTIESWVTAEASAFGELLVDARQMIDRAKLMPDGPVTLAAKEGKLTIKSPGHPRKFTLATMPTSDWPRPMAGGTSRLTLPAATLASLFAHVEHSISTDFTRPHVNSAFLEWDASNIRMVSTDGHCVSFFEVPCHTEGAGSVLIPLKSSKVLMGILANAQGDIAIHVGPSVAHAHLDNCILSMRLPESQFPPYRQVIPRLLRPFTVDRQAFVSAFKACGAAIVNESVASFKNVRVTFSDGIVSLLGESPDQGDATDQIVCDYQGEKIRTGFNMAYIVNAIAPIKTDNVSISVTGELDPIVIRSSDEDNSYLCVVMPAKI